MMLTEDLTLGQVHQATRYRLNDPVADSIQEIADYFRISYDAAKSQFKIGELARADWQSVNEQNQKEVEDYYRKTHGYIYDLMAAFHELENNNLEIINNLLRLIKVCKPKTILDFGCGACWYSILLKRLGADITVADLDGETFKFAKWRIAQRHLNIPTRIADQWNKLGTYDFIYAFSVLEHAFDPIGIMRSLKSHLSQHGFIYLQNDFYHSEPMHLQKNLGLKETFGQEMEALGYRVLRNYENNLVVLTHTPI